jgi:hypothetical protein
MDISATKTGSIIDSISTADKGGDNAIGTNTAAISFSNMLKGDGGTGAQAGAQNALGAMMSRSTDIQAPVRDEPSTRPASDDHYDDSSVVDHADDMPERESVHADTHDDHHDAQDAAPRQSAHRDEGPAQDAPPHHDGDAPASDNHTSQDTGDDHTAADEAPKHADTSDGSNADQDVTQSEGQAQKTHNTDGVDTEKVGQVASDATDGDATQKQGSAAAGPETALAAATGVANTAPQEGKTQDTGKTAKTSSTSSASTPTAGEGNLNKGQAATDAKVAGPAQEKTVVNTQQATQQNANPAQNQNRVSGQEQAAQAATRGDDGKGQQTVTQAQQQAQDLSRRLGGDTRMNVEVSVKNEGETLTSRPNAALAQASSGAGKTAKDGAQQHAQTNTHLQSPQQAQQQAQAAVQAQAANVAQGQNAAPQGNAAQGASTVQAGTVSATSATSGGDGAGQTTTQSTNPTQQTAQTQDAQKQTQSKSAAQQRATVDQVTVQITKALKAGADKINIQLKPASLGRVDVQLEMAQDGRVTATIMADSRETLDMLKNGARDLTRALNSAGLQANSQDLNFSLRENAQQHMADKGNGKNEQLDFNDAPDLPTDVDDMVLAEGAANRILEDGRIDIRA